MNGFISGGVNFVNGKMEMYIWLISDKKIFVPPLTRANGNKRVAQLIANKVLIENNVGIFQIPIEKLEEFKALLILFYETGNDEEIINFMKEYCIRRAWK